MRRILAFALCGAFLVCSFFPSAASAKKHPAPGASAAAGTMPSCNAGDPVVWVNTNSKIFHAQGDEFYGKTKKGQYMCQSAALAGGNRAAKSSQIGKKRSAGANSSVPGAMTSGAPGAMPSSTPDAMATGRKHKRKHGGAMASPPPAAPGAMPSSTPDATATGRKHRRKHRGATASPAPAATATGIK
ncbi:MAG: hypothetical protein GIW95_10925 [Candidatus Eremiobacteraeota bacterium]|nr:hypothetical protein [Candidatus Eremiobacteraeota bacterium]